MRIIIPLASPMTSESAAFNVESTRARIGRIKELITATKARASFKTSDRAKASVARRLALIKELEGKIKTAGKKGAAGNKSPRPKPTAKTSKKGETSKPARVAKDKERQPKVRKTSGDVKAGQKNTKPVVKPDASKAKITRLQTKIAAFDKKILDARSGPLKGDKKKEAIATYMLERKHLQAQLTTMSRPATKAPKAKNAGKTTKAPHAKRAVVVDATKGKKVVTKGKATVDAHTGRRVVTHPVRVHNKDAKTKKAPSRK